MSDGALMTETKLWKAQECADFLRLNKAYFLRFTRHAAGFPKNVPGGGKPLWIAQEVIAWRVGPENMRYFVNSRELSATR